MIAILAIISTSIFFHNYLFSLVLGIISFSLFESLMIIIQYYCLYSLYSRPYLLLCKLLIIKKRWQEYKEHLYKKDLHDQDNHDGVITDLEPDILECEVKWALESITTNKASGGDGIPVALFQILKDDAVKVLHSICQQIWKLSSGHRTGKGQFSFHSQRKAMPKNTQTTAQLHSSHRIVK